MRAHLHARQQPRALRAVAAVEHLDVLRHVLVGGADGADAHAHGAGEQVGDEALDLLLAVRCCGEVLLRVCYGSHRSERVKQGAAERPRSKATSVTDSINHHRGHEPPNTTPHPHTNKPHPNARAPFSASSR